MAFVKVIKSKAYFKRYQVKFRRRREGRTDYYARKRLITQDKNKYNSPKYRFVVRTTNRDIICQIIYSKIEGDRVMAAAYSHELPKYGIKAGLTNYAAAYATGLLCARRLLNKLNLADKYVGQEEADGEMFSVEEIEDGPRPFSANLDIGIQRTTTGAKIFACLKGAVDGGIDIPHNEKRFPGFDKESKELDSETFKERITGEHVASFMEMMEEEEPEKYKEHFSQYIAAGIAPGEVVDMYVEGHAAIRANPVFEKKPSKKGTIKRWTAKKLTKEERDARIQEKIAAWKSSRE